MNENKLYAVEITYKAYVWAPSKYEAENFVSEITGTEDFPEVICDEVDTNILGWDGNCCIYHNGNGDLRLKDVLVAPTH